MSTSTTGFCVDSIKVIEGGVPATFESPLPPFDKMEGASGITVVVPIGRPQKQTGRFLFAPKSVEAVGEVVGEKRSRGEDSTEECALISNADVPLGTATNTTTSGTQVRVPPHLQTRNNKAKDGINQSDIVVSLGAYNRLLREKYSTSRDGSSVAAAQMLNMELVRTQCVRSISVALDASIVTSFVAGKALCSKLEAALIEMAVGGEADDAQKASAGEYVSRVFAFAQGTTSKKKVTMTAPTGLFPALVFECLSAAPFTTAAPNNVETTFDPIIPSPSGRGLGVAVSSNSLPSDTAPTQLHPTPLSTPKPLSNSILMRLIPYYHDLLNRALVLFGTGDKVRAAAEVCARTASMHLCGIVDDMYADVQSRVASASTAAPPAVTATFHTAKGEVFSEYPPPPPVNTNNNNDNGDASSVTNSKVVRYVVLVVNNRRHEMTLRSYLKLRYLFTINTNEGIALTSSSSCATFHMRLFVLLERYYQLLGSSDNFRQEGGWHAAIPLQVLGAMHSRIGVDCEGFSNPFNASSMQFCSAFPDSDCWFGSCGSFFEMEFVSGAIEVNPPFDHSVAVRTAHQINKLLIQAAHTPAPTNSLRFIVVVPTGDSTKKTDQQQDGAGKDLASAVDFVGLLKNGGYMAACMSYDGLASPFRDGCEMAADGIGFVSRFSPFIAYLRSDIASRGCVGGVKEEASSALVGIQSEWASILH